jgi:GTP-binding protein
MAKLSFSKAEYIASALLCESWPSLKTQEGTAMREIAIVGRSNVGKSSLLNNLFRQKKLAKVSSVPGKTQTLNFFVIDEKIALVDLPGYGYAKVSKEIKIKWSECIDLYLRKRPQLSLILLLIDIRHPPTKEDIAFIEWSIYHRKPVILVFTKCDKVNRVEKKQNTENCLKLFPELPYCHYSIEDPKSRQVLIHQINHMLSSGFCPWD